MLHTQSMNSEHMGAPSQSISLLYATYGSLDSMLCRYGICANLKLCNAQICSMQDDNLQQCCDKQGAISIQYAMSTWHAILWYEMSHSAQAICAPDWDCEHSRLRRLVGVYSKHECFLLEVWLLHMQCTRRSTSLQYGIVAGSIWDDASSQAGSASLH